MKIVRAIKCAGISEQLEKALKVAKKTGIKGLEIQALHSLIEKNNFKERGEVVINACKKYGKINSLIYHSPVIEPAYVSVKEIKKYDFANKQGGGVLKFTKDTMKEASHVAKKLNIKGDIPLIVHVFGIMDWFDITNVEETKNAILKKEEFFRRSVNRLKELKNFGEKLSKEKDYSLKLTIESNAAGNRPEVSYSLCCDPRDIEKMVRKIGIGVCLDFAHVKLTNDYLNFPLEHWKKLNKELPAVELTRLIYPKKISLEQSIELLIPLTHAFHLNDVKDGYDVTTEGCEIGKGNFLFKEIFPLIVRGLKKERVIGTYEIRGAHLEAEKIYRSNKKLKEILGENSFQKYFI